MKAQIAITTFPNRELLLDPNRRPIATIELIGRQVIPRFESKATKSMKRL